MVACGACGAEIRWALTDRGARMPLDAEPVKRAILTMQPGSTDPLVEVVDTFMPHHATCPKADQFRKKG